MLVVLSAALTIAGAATPVSAQSTPPRATLTVRVATGADESPVPRAHVRVTAVRGPAGVTSSAPPGTPRWYEGDTDEAGVVVFTNLVPGQYGVYVMSAFGFVRTNRMERIDVASAARPEVVIRVERGGSITGRVVDEAGAPVVRARVRAVSREVMSGAATASPGPGPGEAFTDDRGEFRVFGLPAGE
jgi:uncharacterized GH25 family protein